LPEPGCAIGAQLLGDLWRQVGKGREMAAEVFDGDDLARRGADPEKHVVIVVVGVPRLQHLRKIGLQRVIPSDDG
jgi:hypothetical protein